MDIDIFLPHGAEASGFTVTQKGKRIIIPPAIEHWKKTQISIEVLNAGKAEGYKQYEFIVTNLTIVLLTTGFETYCKVRFNELLEEGKQIDFEELLKKFTTKWEREKGVKDEILKHAEENKVNPSQQLLKDDRINFQSYENCKNAFSKGFGIKFDDIENISSEMIRQIKRNILFRHRIIHVDPMLQPLNEFEFADAKEDPIFPTHEYAEQTTKLFDEFIKLLHNETLNLK